MPPTYPSIPLAFLIRLAWDGVRHKERSFREDAARLTSSLPIEVSGSEYIPEGGPALLVMNHYHRPGFQAFWFGLAISACVAPEIHWTITGAWTDDGSPGAWLRAWLSPAILSRLARVYHFTSMPPMPPQPHEVEKRALAVRHLLRVARQSPPPILALAPEGQDNPADGLMRPHPGVGRLVSILDKIGYRIIPVGIFETENALVLNFGPAFHLSLQTGLDADQRDRQAADLVMQAIAVCLPAELIQNKDFLNNPTGN